MNEITETFYDRLLNQYILNQYNDIKKEVTSKLDLIFIRGDKDTVLYLPVEEVSDDDLIDLLIIVNMLLIKKIATKKVTTSKERLDPSFAKNLEFFRILDEYSPCLRYLEEYDRKADLYYVQVNTTEFSSLLNESTPEVDLRQLIEAISTEATKRATLRSKPL